MVSQESQKVHRTETLLWSESKMLYKCYVDQNLHYALCQGRVREYNFLGVNPFFAMYANYIISAAILQGLIKYACNIRDNNPQILKI